MTKSEAEKVKDSIISFCKQKGLWFLVEEENKPDLRMIRIKEISIKVEAQ